MLLQFTQLFVAFAVSITFSSFLSSGEGRWRTVAWGFLHNSHWVLRLQCLAVWRERRQEKHNPLDIQISILSLTVFSKKFLHVARPCFPSHNVHKLGSLHNDSSL